MFELDPQLQQDTREVGAFPLCRLLLMKDARYPWCILVPQRKGITEIYQLSSEDQFQLQRESVHLARFLANEFQADKLNVAAIGNLVTQLHVHHVVRFRSDDSWPRPVWGQLPSKAYSAAELRAMEDRISVVLKTF